MRHRTRYGRDRFRAGERVIKVNPALGQNYVELMPGPEAIRERLREYATFETYAARVRLRIANGMDEQAAHIAELDAYALELERRELSRETGAA